MKSVFIKDIPMDLGRRLKVAALKDGVSMRDMILAAIGEYLDRRGIMKIEAGKRGCGMVIPEEYKATIICDKKVLDDLDDMENILPDGRIKEGIPKVPEFIKPTGESDDAELDNFTKKGFKRTW